MKPAFTSKGTRREKEERLVIIAVFLGLLLFTYFTKSEIQSSDASKIVGG